MIASNHTENQIGWNEKSFRYTQIEDANEFYIPQIFRQQSKSNRQASEGVIVDNEAAIAIYRVQCESSYQTYRELLQMGVGREQARGVLVPSVYTTFVWTVSLQALLYFLGLRNKPDAQGEIVAYAKAIEHLIKPYVPHTLEIWQEYGG